MELTKEQRHEVYKRALVKFNAGRRYMCDAITDVVQELYDEWYGYASVVQDFPEFAAMKPKRTYDMWGWFPDYEKAKRIKILTDCINLTKPEE